MRYRLMASYLGASYQAAVGPSDRDVTLFAAPPPPEEHGFSPAPGGIWRKQVRLDDLDGLWESRPIGSYHGEPCLVLDDLGDRLHIVYLGMDERRGRELGYWQGDPRAFRGVGARGGAAGGGGSRGEPACRGSACGWFARAGWPAAAARRGAAAAAWATAAWATAAWATAAWATAARRGAVRGSAAARRSPAVACRAGAAGRRIAGR